MYGNVDQIEERHRHRYEVNPDYVAELEKKGMKFVGYDSEQIRMEVMELEGHPYYVGTQFHPEYLSRPLKPSPPFLGLILASVGKLESYLQQGNKIITPSYVGSESSSDEDIILKHQQKTMPIVNGIAKLDISNGDESIKESN